MSRQEIHHFRLSSGQSIPWLGWGNGTGDAKPTAVESGAKALKAGIIHIDTAQGYDNEVETGEALKKAGFDKEKDQIYVTTKLSQEGGAADKDPIPVSQVRASVLATIKRLGFQPNLLLVHNPFVPPKGEIVPFWQELEKMKDSGELKSDIGVSNFRTQDFEELLPVAKYKPVVNQLEFHPFVLSHLDKHGLLALQAKHGILTESYGPLSPLLRHPTGGGPLKPILSRIASRLSSQTGKEVDSAAVLLLWTKAMGVVAVSASGNEERIKWLAEIQRLPDLEKEEVKEIEEIGRKYYHRAYPEHMCVDFEAPDLPEK